LNRQEEPAGGNAGPHLAHAKCSQHRAAGGDVVRHEALECLTDAMNGLWRLKPEAVGEIFVRRGVSGLGLIYEGLAETFFQHANPIKLLVEELFSGSIANPPNAVARYVPSASSLNAKTLSGGSASYGSRPESNRNRVEQ
jgi:hypothetical protein